MAKPIEIKVRGCMSCPFCKIDWHESYCNHPFNMYDGNKFDEFIEHCPLKETETIIKFEIENDGTRQSNTSDKG